MNCQINCGNAYLKLYIYFLYKFDYEVTDQNAESCAN